MDSGHRPRTLLWALLWALLGLGALVLGVAAAVVTGIALTAGAVEADRSGSAGAADPFVLTSFVVGGIVGVVGFLVFATHTVRAVEHARVSRRPRSH